MKSTKPFSWKWGVAPEWPQYGQRRRESEMPLRMAAQMMIAMTTAAANKLPPPHPARALHSASKQIGRFSIPISTKPNAWPRQIVSHNAAVLKRRDQGDYRTRGREQERSSSATVDTVRVSD
jgi:hypothetical protein